jgi:hypothetical protein
MELITKYWYVRYFYWGANLIHKFGNNWNVERSARYYKTHGTYICTFIRVTLFWTPLIVLYHAVFFLFGIYVLIIYPLSHFVIRIFYISLWDWMLSISIFGGVIIIGSLISRYIIPLIIFHAPNQIYGMYKSTGAKMRKFGVITGGHLVWQAVKDNHNKICRKITFKEEEI